MSIKNNFAEKIDREKVSFNRIMKLVIAGASGLIGAALVDQLSRQSHRLILLSRRQRQSTARNQRWLAWQPGQPGEWERALDGADGVINLAGESIAGRRWSGRQKELLRSSRIDATRSVVSAIANAQAKPRFLINASAVGYYGARGNEKITEESAPGNDFLANLCVDWEAEARKAEDLGVRIVLLRTGIVLANNGGALKKMVPPFKMFAGGPLGSGQQYMPWIHLEDEVALIRCLIESENPHGPFNATAPNPVTMGEFARALGTILNRPAWARLPASVLSLVVGEMADMLLASQRVIPEAALKLGFIFKYSKLTDALMSLKL
jgi:uncharacterized protein